MKIMMMYDDVDDCVGVIDCNGVCNGGSENLACSCDDAVSCLDDCKQTETIHLVLIVMEL